MFGDKQSVSSFDSDSDIADAAILSNLALMHLCHQYLVICSLGGRELLWKEKSPANVSTAFSSSPKLSRVFLFNN